MFWHLETIFKNDLNHDLINQKHLNTQGYSIANILKECIMHRNKERASIAYESGQPMSRIIANNNIKNVKYIFFGSHFTLIDRYEFL